MPREFSGTNQNLYLSSAVKTAAPLTVACWINIDGDGTDRAAFGISDYNGVLTDFFR